MNRKFVDSFLDYLVERRSVLNYTIEPCAKFFNDGFMREFNYMFYYQML
jgi:hypothetical protein